MSAYVVVRCPTCGYERRIGPGEVPAESIPICPTDGQPMVAISATALPDCEEFDR